MPSLLTVVQGFQALNDQALLNVQPKRLNVVTAAHGGAFEPLVQPPASEPPTIDDLAVLNQTRPQDSVTAGTPLKLVQ